MNAIQTDWNQLLREEMPPLYRLVSRRVGGDRLLAEDVTQEVWLRALDTWRRSGVPDDPGAWLRTAALNLLRNYFRKRGNERHAVAQVARDAPVDRWLTEETSADDPAGAALLQQGLARLPTEQAELLQERYLDGRSVDELARSLATSGRGIEGRLRRARAALAKAMGAGLDGSNATHGD